MAEGEGEERGRREREVRLGFLVTSIPAER